MNVAQEIERLAKLHAEGALTAEEFARAKSQLLSTPAFSKFPVKGIRHESPRKFFGLPLWAIAIGPDWERGEMRGHARGFFALGDIATGWFAFGGLARGLFAFGGLAIGLFAPAAGFKGSKISADVTDPLAPVPPATRTLPFGKSVAV